MWRAGSGAAAASRRAGRRRPVARKRRGRRPHRQRGRGSRRGPGCRARRGSPFPGAPSRGRCGRSRGRIPAGAACRARRGGRVVGEFLAPARAPRGAAPARTARGRRRAGSPSSYTKVSTLVAWSPPRNCAFRRCPSRAPTKRSVTAASPARAARAQRRSAARGGRVRAETAYWTTKRRRTAGASRRRPGRRPVARADLPAHDRCARASATSLRKSGTRRASSWRIRLSPT